MSKKNENKFDISYNNIEKEESVDLKDIIMSPLNHEIHIKNETWEQHIGEDHPDRFFYNNEDTYKQILETMSAPKYVFSDKDNEEGNIIRLNYFGVGLIETKGKTSLKFIKVVTEAKGNNITQENYNNWDYEDFVTVFFQRRNTDDFDGRYRYDI